MYSTKMLTRSLLVVVVAGVLLALAEVPRVWHGKWLLFDAYDLNVYFNSSRWIIEGGRLYREVWSEYPLLANAVFAIWRYLGNLVYPGLMGFQYAWVIPASLIFIWAVQRVAAGTTLLAAFAWVMPASIYFALYRFDIYPAAATLLAMFAIRRRSYTQGAIWLGVAAAFKGYVLFLLPAFCVFMIYQRGFVAALRLGVLVAVPTMLALLASLTFVSWEEALAPFKYHAQRGFNGQSTYDAINYLFEAQLSLNHMSFAPQSLQVAFALAAAAMRPRTFEELVNAFVFAVLGFMTFSVFYSPQFVLWLLPLVSFSGSRIMLSSAIALSWLTYLYFPIIFNLAYGTALFQAIVVAVTLARLFMMILAIIHCFEFWFLVPWRNKNFRWFLSRRETVLPKARAASHVPGSTSNPSGYQLRSAGGRILKFARQTPHRRP
jgi:hypothetical protein